MFKLVYSNLFKINIIIIFSQLEFFFFKNTRSEIISIKLLCNHH